MRSNPITAAFAAALLLGAACSSSSGGPGGTTITVLGYTVTIKTAPPATALVGTAIPVAFTVTENMSDGSSRPASGKSFTVTVTSGGGTVNGVTTTTLSTASDGSVALTWLLGPTVGTQSVRGSVAADKFLDVTVVATAPPATQLGFSTAPSGTAQNGIAFVQQPTVQLKDASGLSVAQAGVVITVAIDVGGGTLSGGSLTSSTNASGAAAFSGLTITGLAGTRTLKFSATLDGIPVSLSATIVVTAGAASQLLLTTAPSATTLSGVLLAQQPVVQLQDVSGNPVAQAAVSVTVVIDAGGSGAIGGTTLAATNASGAASYSNLSLTGIAGARSLKFTAILGGAPASVNATVTILPDPATQLTITTQPPATITANFLLAPSPSVQLRDPSGAPVSQAGIVVTATIAAGTMPLSGTLTATTNASGLATFTNLRLGAVGAVSLRFSAALPGTGLTSVVSNATVTTLPSNGKIAFVAGKGEIWAVNPNGSGLTQLTPGYGTSTCHLGDRDPSWSPDGSKIAFARTQNELMEIWVMNADGSNQTRLTFFASSGTGCASGGGPSATYSESPSWSPDGSKIIFASERSTVIDDQDLWIMNADGTNQAKFYGSPLIKEGNPVFSRDGQTIAFVSSVINFGGTGCRGGTDGGEIWLLNGDGSNPRQHTAITGCSIEYGFSWTLDGQKLYFTMNKASQPCDVELFSITTDPNNLVRVQYTNCSFGNASTNSVVSPDGTKIVYNAVGGGGVLRTMNLDGSGMATLNTGVLFQTVTPSWQPIP